MEERNKRLRKASGEVDYKDRLTCFLYLLMRDDLPAGKVEQIVREAASSKGKCMFSNGWLAQYAHNLSKELIR